MQHLPYKTESQYVHFRLHTDYFLLPWKIPEERWKIPEKIGFFLIVGLLYTMRHIFLINCEHLVFNAYVIMILIIMYFVSFRVLTKVVVPAEAEGAIPVDQEGHVEGSRTVGHG